ncbi:MAG TPA: radical SAM protein [Candidatus Omnitrophota bacterium]|nr:radical SAM protein [Candidatus Omnitrophota bacterium]HPS19509.1 radical SAM protein [Candidatus Omnitrophota bacterium]
MSQKSLKIAFLQTGDVPYLGIMSLSAVLKKRGFVTDVFCIGIDNDIENKIIGSGADILACSAMTPTFSGIRKVYSAVKKKAPHIYTILGGPHSTFFPNVLHEDKDLDAICIGEGEGALIELATALRDKSPRTDIKNIWFKDKGRIVENEIRDLIDDLDALPFLDRDVFFEKYPFMAAGTVRFITARGCPFRCTYCFNIGMQRLYKGKGNWVRYHSIERSLSEIKDIKERYPLKWVSFMDDTFNLDKKRLKEFLLRYKKEIDVPFLCQLRVDVTEEEQIEWLKNAGVSRITIGIEHGNETVRKNILSRNISNEQILNCAKWINERKVRLTTQNLIGLPWETVDTALETIKINAKIKPEIANVNILNPYPGTAIYSLLEKEGLLADDFDFNALLDHSNSYSNSHARIHSYVKNKVMPQLISLRCFFSVLIACPWLEPLVRLLIKIRYNRVYEFIWQVSTGTFRVSWKYGGWRDRKVLMRKLFAVLIKG